jgi:hypothetical protein
MGCTTAGLEPAPVDDRTPAAPAGRQSPATIEELWLRQSAAGAEIRLVGDAPLVATQYRDRDGLETIELFNSRPSPAIESVRRTEGLVASLQVETGTAGRHPMTRLTVRTRRPVKSAIAVDGTMLELQLTPSRTPEATNLVEPLRRDAPSTSLHPPGSLAPPTLPAEPGRTFRGVDLVSVGAATVVDVVGDGLFSYSTSRLSGPPRFVIDLHEVTDASRQSTVAVNSDAVIRVRSAQFEPPPHAITRVVFDLRQDLEPVIQGAGQGLRVSFGSGAAPIAPPAARARTLRAIEVQPAVGTTVLEAVGDGPFAYSTLRLRRPDRFVIDLEDVINACPRPTVAVNSAAVVRVRVAQFQPPPNPVTRIVFDLRQDLEPSIEVTSRGLRVRFSP